jgi:hypothetical protein
VLPSGVAPATDDVASGTWLVERPGGPAGLEVRRCRFEVVAGPDAGLVVELAQPRIVIGRGPADVTLTDRRVSALHCELTLEPAGYRLRDLDSTNGTRVFGVRVIEALIEPGATLAVGDSAVRFAALADAALLPLWREPHFAGMIGASPVMRRLFDAIARVAATDATALVTGETGVGKERVAEAIHEQSPRRERPFVVVDCASIPRELIASELFGHAKGSYTGAIADKRGLIEAAPAARCSSTRSASCRSTCSRSSCGRSRSARSAGSARPGPIAVDIRRAGRDPPRPARDGEERRLPRGPVLPAGGGAAATCRRCAPGPRPADPGAFFAESLRPLGVGAVAGAPGRSGRATTGRATSASCATSSSARCRPSRCRGSCRPRSCRR